MDFSFNDGGDVGFPSKTRDMPPSENPLWWSQIAYFQVTRDSEHEAEDLIILRTRPRDLNFIVAQGEEDVNEYLRQLRLIAEQVPRLELREAEDNPRCGPYDEDGYDLITTIYPCDERRGDASPFKG